jgi:hypothetical protein
MPRENFEIFVIVIGIFLGITAFFLDCIAVRAIIFTKNLENSDQYEYGVITKVVHSHRSIENNIYFISESDHK